MWHFGTNKNSDSDVWKDGKRPQRKTLYSKTYGSVGGPTAEERRTQMIPFSISHNFESQVGWASRLARFFPFGSSIEAKHSASPSRIEERLSVETPKRAIGKSGAEWRSERAAE